MSLKTSKSTTKTGGKIYPDEGGGGSGSNRQLLSDNFELSNQPFPLTKQSEAKTGENLSMLRGNIDLQQRADNASKTSKTQDINVRQSTNTKNGLQQIIILDNLETEQQLLTDPYPEKIQGLTIEDQPILIKNSTQKGILKVDFNQEIESKNVHGVVSKGGIAPLTELPTHPGDNQEAAGQFAKQGTLMINPEQMLKKGKSKVPTKKESTKIINSYITSVSANIQIKNALTIKNNNGLRSTTDHDKSGDFDLEEAIQIVEGQDSKENDINLQHLSLWQKILHTLKTNTILTSVIPFNSQFRMYWDFFIIALSLWVCFTTPLDIAFEPLTFKLSYIVLFNKIIDILFILDIVINFRTSIADFITGDEITDSKTIAIQYIKGQLIIDLIAAIPMDLILGISYNMDPSQLQVDSHHRLLYGSAAAASAQIPLSPNPTIHSIAPDMSVNLINILSLLKIMRILRFTKIITFLNTTENIKLSLRLFKLIFYLMIYIHWQACAWFYYTKWDRMWLPLPDIIREDYHFYDHGVIFTYCFSIWHSVSILDGDDMVPANAHQAIVVSVLVIISEFIHAHIIGTMDVVLHSLSSKSVHFQEKIEFVTTTMKSIRLDHDVQQQVLKYVSKVHTQMDQRKHLNSLMDTLSPSLQHLITRHMFLNIIAAHPVFTSLPELFDFLLESIEAVQYMPEQYVFKEGAKATHLYVLENGQCEVLVKGSVLRKEIHVSEIEPGCIFGEVALINGVRRTASVRSKVHCTVGAIREETFQELIRYFPEVKNRMKEQCRKYSDHWKDYQINVLSNIHYMRNVPQNVREDLHYKLTIEHFEPGAKLFNRGQECERIMIVVNGQVELYVEQREKKYVLDTIGLGSTIGAYSVLNNSRYEYTGLAKNKVSCLLLQRLDLLDAAKEYPLMTEALDSATQYILLNKVPLCDYSTLNNNNPVDKKDYQEQFDDDAVTPIERFKLAIQKVIVLNRRNEPKLSKLFATIKRLKEERDQKEKEMAQVTSENESIGEKLKRGLQRALFNVQKVGGDGESEAHKSIAQIIEQESGRYRKSGAGGFGVPMKEFMKMMQMMESIQKDMKLVKLALNITSETSNSNQLKQSSEQPVINYEASHNQLIPQGSKRNSKRYSKQFGVIEPQLNFQERIDILEKEQAALPQKKNMIALLMNAEIQLQKEQIMKEKMEKESADAAIIAQEQALKVHDSNLNVIKPKSKRSSVKSQAMINLDNDKGKRQETPQNLNVNKTSSQSINGREAFEDLQDSINNSKHGSISPNQDRHVENGPLVDLSNNETADHKSQLCENITNTRASSVLKKRDLYDRQKQNSSRSINQQSKDGKISQNFMASEAYSNNFDVPQIQQKDGIGDIRHHFTLEDENFKDAMPIRAPPYSKKGSRYSHNIKADQPDIDSQENLTIEIQESQNQSPLIQEIDYQQVETILIEPIINDILLYNNGKNHRNSLEQFESIKEEESVKEENEYKNINIAVKETQDRSRNPAIPETNNHGRNHQLFKSETISLQSIELTNKLNMAFKDAVDASRQLIADNAKHNQSSLHQQRSNFTRGDLRIYGTTSSLTPTNISNSQLIIRQDQSQEQQADMNKKNKTGVMQRQEVSRSINLSQVVSLSSNGVGSKNLKSNYKSFNGLTQNPSKINYDISSDQTPKNLYNNQPHQSSLNHQLSKVIGQQKQVNHSKEINKPENNQKQKRSPSPPLIPTIIESKVELNPNQLLHPKARAEAARDNPYLGSLPVPKPYTGSISIDEKSKRVRQQPSKPKEMMLDLSKVTNNQQRYENGAEDGSIDSMIEQEIARIHSNRIANMQNEGVLEAYKKKNAKR